LHLLEGLVHRRDRRSARVGVLQPAPRARHQQRGVRARMEAALLRAGHPRSGRDRLVEAGEAGGGAPVIRTLVFVRVGAGAVIAVTTLRTASASADVKKLEPGKPL